MKLFVSLGDNDQRALGGNSLANPGFCLVEEGLAHGDGAELLRPAVTRDRSRQREATFPVAAGETQAPAMAARFAVRPETHRVPFCSYSLAHSMGPLNS